MNLIWTAIQTITIITIVAYFINNVFLYNKTSYILIGSIFLFTFVSILFFILELEFLAITFSMIYVGGIAVMFLFLILVVDVNIENVEGTKLTNLKLINCVLIGLISFVITIFLQNSFDAFLFLDLDSCIRSKDIESIIKINSLSDFEGVEFDITYAMFVETLADLCFTQNHSLLLVNSVDLWVLSVLLFKSFSILIVLLAFYLTVAVVVSLIFCSNTFEKFLNFRF